MSRVYSTNPPTVKVPHQARWITFRESRECAEALFVFTDGSSLGGFAAILVENGEFLDGWQAWKKPTPTRNVAAELNGVLLGLSKLPPWAHEVVVVTDYLGPAAWLTRNWKIKKDEVRDKIAAIQEVIDVLCLAVTFVHHKGHQRPDESDFSYWNTMADAYASRTAPGVFRVPNPGQRDPC